MANGPSEQPHPSDRRARAATAVLSALLLGLVAWVYRPAASHEFIAFDDRTFLVENHELDAGLDRDGLAWALTTTLDGNWIPVTWVSFLVDREIHGLSAGGTHVTNVVLHGLATVLLFLALVRLTGDRAPSAFTAAVFAVHPLHVESVAWAIERKDVLSAVFFAGALWAYAGYAARPGRLRYAAVLALHALGLLAKPMTVTLPAVLLLLDAWPLRRLESPRSIRRAVVEKLPLFGLSAAASVVTVLSQSSAGILNRADLSLPWRLANAAASYGSYLRKAVLPVDLAIFYPHPGADVPIASVAAGAALLASLSLLAALQWRRRPWIGVGWLWFVGMLLPVIGIVQVGDQAMADRYAYLPLVGATLPVAWGGLELARRSRASRVPVGLCGVLAVLACAALSRAQLATWRDGLSVFEHAVAVTERNARAHNGAGLELLERGRLEEARRHLVRAIEIEPDFVDAHVNLGAVLRRAGAPEEAIDHLRRGLGLRPGRRVGVHAQLGAAELERGRAEAALTQAHAGLAIDPDSGALHAVGGIALVSLGRLRKGEQWLRRALELGVDDLALRRSLALSLQGQGRVAEAVERYRDILARWPEDVASANNLAWILATSRPDLRRPEEAVRLAEGAARGDPTDPNVLDTLAVAYHAAGRQAEALQASRRAADAARARGDEELARAIEERAADWEDGGGRDPESQRPGAG